MDEVIEKSALEKSTLALKQSRLLRWAIVLAGIAALGYGLGPGLLNLVARGLVRDEPLVKSDIVVALGGDSRCHREKRAAELYQQGWARKVIVSGVQISWGIHTADAAKKYVMSLGVPESDILTIRDTWNTRVEANVLDKMMRENGWHSAILVTSAFHSRRAAFTVRRAAEDFTFVSSPVPPVAPEWEPDRWWTRRTDLTITMREFLSWTNTLLGGWQ